MSDDTKDPASGTPPGADQAAPRPRRTPLAAPQFTGPIAGDGKVGQDRPRDFSTRLDAPAIEPAEVDAIDAMPTDDKIANLRFMQDMMTITVLPSTEQFAEPIVEVSNAGINQFFVRGQPTKVKRMFVECLLRAKPTGYTESVYIDRETGDAIQRMNPMTALRYPFQVNHDPAGARGMEWMQKTMMEP